MRIRRKNRVIRSGEPALGKCPVDGDAKPNSCRSVCRWFPWILFACLTFASGCSDALPTGYGVSKGFLAQRSVNGFTTLRGAFREAGFYDRELTRLTDRSRRMSVVVWTPSHPAGIEVRTTAWFDRWFTMGNKTLIYVIPDSGSESDFYRDARPFASPAQRLEYRRKYAERLIVEHGWQLQRTPIPSNGWFSVKPKVQRSQMEFADDEIAMDLDWTVPDEDGRPRRFEWVIEAYDAKDKTQQTGGMWQPVGPGSPSISFNTAVVASSTSVDFEPVLVSEDGDTLVARVTSKRWKGSQILVVAGGSLLTNYGLTRPANQELADQLIETSIQNLIDGNVLDEKTRLLSGGVQPQVGFSNANGVMPISEKVGEIPKASGAELLTVFPISFVTIHLAVIGFVICLMLLPIFGRPQQVDRGVLTHFGDHLSAVATLMRRRGGETYARRRISDYMRLVREETSGPWVIETASHPTDPALHLHVPQAPAGVWVGKH